MKRESGFTLIELLVTLSLVAILTGTVVSNLKEISDPLANASFGMEHFLRLARAYAISNTSVAVVSPSSSTGITVSTSDSCTGTLTPISSLVYNLPTGATLSSTTWSVCFTPRGLADDSVSFVISDISGGTKTISVALGGASRVS